MNSDVFCGFLFGIAISILMGLIILSVNIPEILLDDDCIGVVEEYSVNSDRVHYQILVECPKFDSIMYMHYYSDSNVFDIGDNISFDNMVNLK